MVHFVLNIRSVLVWDLNDSEFHHPAPDFLDLIPSANWLSGRVSLVSVSESGSQKSQTPDQYAANVEYKIDYISKTKNHTKKLTNLKIRSRALHII